MAIFTRQAILFFQTAKSNRRAAYRRGRVHPFLQLSNLTNTGHQEIQGVPMPGRTVIVGVEWVIQEQ
jgi:hypothetical protein